MAVAYHREVESSREGVDAVDRSSTTELAYYLYGEDDVPTMRTYIDTEGLAPSTYDGLVYKSLNREQVEREVWRWGVNYVEKKKADESNDELDVGELRVSFDTTGGRLKVTHTPDYSTRVTKYPSSGGDIATDHKGAINVRNGKPEGVEIPIPVFKFTVHYRHSKAVSMAAFLTYAKSLYDLTGRVNDASFYGFAAKEVLYLGSTGTAGLQSDPVLDHHFAASENLTGLIFGGITGVAKSGHDYLWLEYEPEQDGTSKRLRPKPIGVYVHEIHEAKSFTGIGIGTAA